MDDTSQRIAQLFDFCYWISASLNPNLGKSEPPANVKVVGLLAYADNINWAPGTAAGLFVWNGSAWKEFYGTWNLTPNTYTGPTTKVDRTATYTLGTVYQNTTGKPMWIRIMGTANSAAGNLFLYADGSNPPTYLVDKTVMYFVGNDDSVGAVILPNEYYKATYDGGATMTKWTEWY